MERDLTARSSDRNPNSCLWRRALLALVLAAFMPLAHALGLGPIEVRSALNEPLEAFIPLTQARPEEIEDLTVSLAPLEAFRQLGLEITPDLRRLRFKVEEDGQGGYRIHVTSSAPMQEPFLSFVIALEWPKGRLLREYTVLLDPPLLSEEPAPAVPSAASSGQGEAPLPEMEAAPAPEQPPAAPSPLAEEGTGAPFAYGPVRPGETLSTIAQRVHPPEVTLEQMMIALYRANSEAFYGNINLLKAGSVLRLEEDPRSAAARFDPDEARAEVMRQYRAWRAAREGRGGPALVSAQGAAGAAAAGGGEARLELVAPEAGSEAGAGGGGDELAQRVAELEQRLALASESAAAAERENEVLAQRVSALEEQVAALQRLVALRDEQLARLGAAAGERAPSGQEQALAVGDGGDAAPAPPRPVLPPPAKPSPWQDPLILSALVGGGSLLLLGGWFLWYRRRAREADEEWTQTLLQSESTTDETGTAEHPTAAEAGADAGVPEVPSVPSEPVSQAKPQAASGEIDPLAEADVYLAYGSYDQARQVIDQALEAEPERPDLLLKRLEVAYNERDVDAFCHYAEALLEALGNDTDRPEWQRVKAMGEDLVPDHPWFREHTQILESALESAPAQETEGVENPDEVTLFAEESEMEAPVEEGRAVQEAAGETAQGAEAEGQAAEAAPVQEAADSGLGLQPLEEAGEAEPAASQPPAYEVASELDLVPLEEGKTEETGAQEAPEAVSEGERRATGGETAEEEYDGNAFFVFTDEVGTKLDLARAYIEMGDKEGARELLEEVVAVGDEEQRAEAEALLKDLA